MIYKSMFLNDFIIDQTLGNVTVTIHSISSKGSENMKISDNAYANMVKSASPNSNSIITIPSAFVIGGAICALGQLFIALYTYLGVSKEVAPPAASCTLVALTALLTGLNVFDNIAKKAGAGTLVPITGFANAVSSPAVEFRTEGLVLGVGAKMFSVAGPVIVWGLTASIVYGLFIFFMEKL